MENKKCLKPPTRLPEGYLSNLPLFTVPPASRAPDVAVDVFTDARKEGVPGVRAVNVPGKIEVMAPAAKHGHVVR